MYSSSEFYDTGSGLVGVGIMFQQRPDNVVAVKSVIPGGPADRSGNIRAGDMISRVNGQDVQGRSLATLRGLIMGEPGTIVTLGVVREQSGHYIEVPLVRSATGQTNTFLQPNAINGSRTLTTAVPRSVVVGYPEDADRLRHALRQSEAVIKQHEDDLHNMRLMLERQRRDSDTRTVTLEEQTRRLEADRYRLETEKRAYEDAIRKIETRNAELEAQNAELRARQGMLSEEVNIAINKENMTARLVQELQLRNEDERRALEMAIARDTNDLNIERAKRAEAEAILSELSEEVRRMREEERLRREREVQNRIRFDAERKRIEDIYTYSAQVAQILASVDPRLESLEREIFAGTGPISTSLVPAISRAPSAPLPILSSTHSLGVRNHSPNRDDFFIA